MNRTDLGAIASLIVAAACALSGCDRGDPVGPPEVRFGRDECAECKMSVVDERTAAAMRVRTPDGLEDRLFDDFGCLLDMERGQANGDIAERWTRDYASREWMRAEHAWYLFSEKIHTPMGSWIAAYATREAADQAQSDMGGDVLTFDELKARRAAWMEKRYGKTDG